MGILTLAACDAGAQTLDGLTTIVNRRVRLLVQAVRQSRITDHELLDRLSRLPSLYSGEPDTTAVLAAHEHVRWYVPLAPCEGFNGTPLYVCSTTSFLLCAWRNSTARNRFDFATYPFHNKKRIEMRGTDPILLSASLETLFARVVEIIPEIRVPLQKFKEAATHCHVRLSS